jgi:hypothetical protein
MKKFCDLLYIFMPPPTPTWMDVLNACHHSLMLLHSQNWETYQMFEFCLLFPLQKQGFCNSFAWLETELDALLQFYGLCHLLMKHITEGATHNLTSQILL